MNRQVYIVYEPRSDERIVPMVIQAVAGFSHAKLVVLEQGTMSGPGKVYHIGKERDSSMGQLRRDNIEQWGGLDEGERPLLVCATSLTDDQIIARGMYAKLFNNRFILTDSKGNQVIEEMGGYNLIFSNCQGFAFNLARKISTEAPNLLPGVDLSRDMQQVLAHSVDGGIGGQIDVRNNRN